jgi:Ca-activated chloride channel homolog
MNFAQPGYLILLLLLPFLVLGAVLASRLRQKQWAVFAAPRLRQALVKGGSALPRWLAFVFLLAACLVIIFALARPQGDAGTKLEKTVGRNVMIALDISKSMRVSDVKPDRLSQAKVVIYELLEAMPNERIGMIGFAGTPNSYAPLTIDHGAVRETVEQIDETWAPLGGSDLAAAVRLATETLKKTGQKNNALVIISDGEENEGELNSMISEAEQAGVYIIAIGVGTENGDYVPDRNAPDGKKVDQSGHAIISRLQTTVLRRLAEETKGKFTIAGSGQDIPALVKSVVVGLDSFEMDGRERRILIEFYQWLLLPGIFFLTVAIIAGTRWKGVRAALCFAGIFLTLPTARASEASQAKAQLTGKNYEQARDSYHKLAEKERSSESRARYSLGEGTAAYRAEDLRGARSAFSQSLLSGDAAVQSQGHLGMGNSLFQLGWKGLTGELYPTAQATLPDLASFDTLVKEVLVKLSQEEEPEEGELGGYVKIESLITNWADAVRHYESALTRSPADPVATQNHQLTMTYLKRLQELLIQEKQEMEQAMPKPGAGPPGEGEDGEDGDEGDGGKKKPGKKGKGKGKKGDKNKPGKKGDKDKNGDKGDKGEKREDGEKPPDNYKKDESGEEGADPNETQKDRALRLLKENSDLEKGPLTLGRRDFSDAEKDW